jgi:hypothetical protein
MNSKIIIFRANKSTFQQDRTKQFGKIVGRIKWARNMIAHPYRVEADGRDRSMSLDGSFRLERVASANSKTPIGSYPIGLGRLPVLFGPTGLVVEGELVPVV